MAEEVFFTSGLINFFTLLARTQVHVGVKAGKFVDAKTAEGLIALHIPQCILSEGAYGNDLALALDRVDHVAESLLFSQAASGELGCVEGALTQAQLIRVPLIVDDLALTFSSEHGLNLLENRSELHLRRR